MKKVSKILSVVLALCLVLQMGAICVFAEDAVPTETQIIAPLTSFAGASEYSGNVWLGKPADATTYGGFLANQTQIGRAEAFGVFGKAADDSVLKSTSTTTDKMALEVWNVANVPVSTGDYIHFSTDIAFDNDVATLYFSSYGHNGSAYVMFGGDKTLYISRYGNYGDTNLLNQVTANGKIFNQPISVYFEAAKWYKLDVVYYKESTSKTTMSIYLDNVLLGSYGASGDVVKLYNFNLGIRPAIVDFTDKTKIIVPGVETYLDNISMTKYSGYASAPDAVAAVGTTALSAASSGNLKQQYNAFYTIGDMTVGDVMSSITVPEGVNAIYTNKNFEAVSDTSSAAVNGYIKATDAFGNVTWYSVLTDMILAYDDFSDETFEPRFSKYIALNPASNNANYDAEYVGGVAGKDSTDTAVKLYSKAANPGKITFSATHLGSGWDAYDTMPLVVETDFMFTATENLLEIYPRGINDMHTSINGTMLSLNEWHRLTLVYDGNSLYRYVDGKAYGSPSNASTSPKTGTFEISMGVQQNSQIESVTSYLDNYKQYYADRDNFFANGAAKETIADYMTAESSSANITISDGSVLLKSEMAYADFMDAVEASSNVADIKVYADNTYASVVESGKISDGNVLVLTTADGAKEYYAISAEKTEGSIAFAKSTDEETGDISLTATATVTTNKAEAPYVLILAEIDDDTFKVYTVSDDAAVNGSASKTVTYDNNKTYKAFIFDSLTNISPLGGCATYNDAQ